jgi:hypothetical protein
MKILKYFFIAFGLGLFLHPSAQAQTNIVVRNLFASSTLIQDSVSEKAQVRITFFVNRPDQIARIDFKIGKTVETGEVFAGTAGIEKRGTKYYSVFNNWYVELKGEKITLYWIGDKAQISNAKYVSVTLQGSDGNYTLPVYSFIRNF